MADTTAIEWCDSTFNPWTGCTKVSPGCDRCYAEAWAKRSGTVQWGPHAERRRTTPTYWLKPLQWQAQAAAFRAQHGRPRRVFCASLADVFDNAVPIDWLRDLCSLIERTPDLRWILVTKRIGNVFERLIQARSHDWLAGQRHVALLISVTSQAEADRDIPKLLATPACTRGLSLEPMLRPIDLERPRPGPDLHQGGGRMICQPWLIQSGIDWVICGGESGPRARPMQASWARSLRDQCMRAGVPFLFKQWGEFAPAEANDADPTLDAPDRLLHWSDGSKWDRFDGQRGGVELVARVGKKAAGRLLDDCTHDEFPRSLS